MQGVCDAGWQTVPDMRSSDEEGPVTNQLIGFVGKDSDHLQLIKFWPYCTPGRGFVRGENFWLPYHSQHAVFASPLSTLFIIIVNEVYVTVIVFGLVQSLFHHYY